MLAGTTVGGGGGGGGKALTESRAVPTPSPTHATFATQTPLFVVRGIEAFQVATPVAARFVPIFLAAVPNRPTVAVQSAPRLDVATMVVDPPALIVVGVTRTFTALGDAYALATKPSATKSATTAVFASRILWSIIDSNG